MVYLGLYLGLDSNCFCNRLRNHIHHVFIRKKVAHYLLHSMWNLVPSFVGSADRYLDGDRIDNRCINFNYCDLLFDHWRRSEYTSTSRSPCKPWNRHICRSVARSVIFSHCLYHMVDWAILLLHLMLKVMVVDIIDTEITSGYERGNLWPKMTVDLQ